MNRDWDALESFSDWSETLHDILNDATVALQSDDLSNKVSVQKELNTFIMKSPNNITGQLDDIARRAINDIFKTAIQKSLGSIASRTADLSSLTKSINYISNKTESAAKSIRLERVDKFIISSTDLIRTLNDLKVTVTESDDTEALQGKIDKALKAVQDLVPSIMAIK